MRFLRDDDFSNVADRMDSGARIVTCGLGRHRRTDMQWMRAAAIAALAAAVSQADGGRPAPNTTPHWRAIAQNRYAPPAGGDVRALATELIDLLASPDPELRDEIAYSTLASWIYQQKLLDAATVRGLADRLLANMTAHVGERDNDTVFRRSFSTLALSVIVARDNVDPVLDADAWHRIDAAALSSISRPSRTCAATTSGTAGCTRPRTRRTC